MHSDTLTNSHLSAVDSQEAQRWVIVIAQFAAAQRQSGIDPETLRRRLRHVNQFAAYTELGVDEVTTSEFSRWVLSRQVGESTHGSMNDSGRAFYRWAFACGIVRENPLRESHRCAPSRAPESWETHIQAWERHMRGLGRLPSTVTQRGRSVRKFARDNAPIEPWDVKMDHILDWFADNGWGRETIRQRRSAIKDFYRWARRTDRTTKNPAKKLPVVPMQRAVPRPAEEEDVRRSIRLADDRERLAIELAAGLGLRCGEVAGLHSSDLRERDGQWWLRVLGKGARERMLPVPESIATSLRSREHGYVFPGQVNGHISPQYLSKRVNAALPPGVTMHQLRHRFATVAYEKTRDTFVIQKLLGHSSPATTQAYVALSDLSLRSAVEAVADHR